MITDRLAAVKGLTHLYHYQSFNLDRLREVIVGGTIYFSKPSDFNDPWDCRPWYDLESLKDPAVFEQHLQLYMKLERRSPECSEARLARTVERYRAKPDMLADVIRDLSAETAKSFDERYRIYCLGTKPDCELMWAHYTTKHQGVCLEFSVQDNLLFGQAAEVRYVRDYPRFTITDGPDERFEAFLTKSASWSYENEFRLIGDENEYPSLTAAIATKAGKFAIPPMTLTAVILGCSASDSTRKSIADLVSSSRQWPKLKIATRMKDRYQLEIRDCGHFPFNTEFDSSDKTPA
ncbi:DUF2971 domain-containing protein [Bradyrhizobium commune]|uniref:DUF2971 domain-containing protein n=1 Tax=Bradyrhizobium commune TaxID=83627 RepID=A0A7S9D9N8_9BRAD|nr:DUF2971 domain-containing protein [Bradyrhizobium commune]QPF93759.1 DUF2971 domain-containing protein [Bradyrhizobium commune]